MDYEAMLAKSARSGVSLDTEAGAAALERFKRFFGNLTPERVRNDAAFVYAADAILHDTLATHEGVEAIQAYLLRTAERAAGVKVDILRVLTDGSDAFLVWRMDITWSAFRQKGRTTRSHGMSHIRFDADGKVALHHDFWDSASGFFEHLPLVGTLIRWIKRKV